MNQKTVLITGANSGIGLATVKKFFRVLLHGRSLVIKFNTPLYLNELEDKKRTTFGIGW